MNHISDILQNLPRRDWTSNLKVKPQATAQQRHSNYWPLYEVATEMNKRTNGLLAFRATCACGRTPRTRAGRPDGRTAENWTTTTASTLIGDDMISLGMNLCANNELRVDGPAGPFFLARLELTDFLKWYAAVEAGTASRRLWCGAVSAIATTALMISLP